MRHGFTTGSCAAAAAKAAARMLLTGEMLTEVSITTPKGLVYTAELTSVLREKDSVTCGVRKDGGDDPDVTTGLIVFARVSRRSQPNGAGYSSGKSDPSGVDHSSVNGELCDAHYPSGTGNSAWDLVRIEGGEGVGRVTLPGLDQPVGNAAINSVPRKMIQQEVMEVLRQTGSHQLLDVLISVPGGAEVAARTFNPRLGIVGGISILGTSGVVEPMSAQALLDTIRVELRQKKECGASIAAMTPGNYGRDFMQQVYGFDLEKSVKCSNFIGASIDMAAELGFQRMLLTGHLGKMVKVSGGIMNTHSHEGDCRMELLAAAGLRAGVEDQILLQILRSATTDEAVRILREAGVLEEVMEKVMERIHFYLKARSAGRMQIECIVYSSVEGLLGKTDGAMEMLSELMEEE